MEQRDYEKLEKMLCKELKQITDKGELSAGSLETVDKLTHALKNVYKIQMGYDGGYSGANGDWTARGGYSSNRMMPDRSYDSYNNGDSYARRGQHYVRGHYSYDDGMDMIERRIDEMMNQPGMSEHDKRTLQKALEVMR